MATPLRIVAPDRPCAPRTGAVGFRLAIHHPERITAVISQNGNAYLEGLSEGWNPIQAYWKDPSPENRAALERELEQLRAEVADLKNQIQALREPPRPVPPETVPPSKTPAAPPTNADKGGDLTFTIPGREHISRAASAVQDAWQHFVDLVIRLTNDIRRKTGA